MPSASPSQFSVSNLQKEQLATDLSTLRKEIDKNLSLDGFSHLKKIQRWGRACSLLVSGNQFITRKAHCES